MYQEQDYIMRIIHEIARTLIKLIFGIDIDRREEKDTIAPEIKERYKKFSVMVDEGQIEEAENQLTDNLDHKNRNDFCLALLFYEYLNRKDDDFLEAHHFSREEVRDGLKYVVNMYGCAGLLEAFLEESEETEK